TPAPVQDRRTARIAAPTTRAGVRPRSTCSAGPAGGAAGPAPVAGAVEAPSSGSGLTAHTPSSSRSPPRERGDARRSRLRPGLGVRALGELLQERVHFSRDLQRGLGLGQFPGQTLVLAAEPLELDLLGRASLLRLAGQPLPGSCLGLFAPLRDMRGVQAFAAQNRPTLLGALRPAVVLGKDLGLVLRGEGSACRPSG